jgi:hypothetical protein
MTQFTFTRTYNNVTPLPYDGFYYDNLANTFTLWVETPQVFYNYLEEPDMGIIITSQDAAVNIQVVLKASQFSLLNDQVGQWVITAAAQYYVGGAVVGSNPLVVGTPYYVSFELGDGDLSHLVPSGSLAGLSDVLLTSPSNGQVLTYVTPADKWENVTPAAGLSPAYGVAYGQSTATLGAGAAISFDLGASPFPNLNIGAPGPAGTTFTILYTGVYSFNFQVVGTPSSGTNLQISLYHNGALDGPQDQFTSNSDVTTPLLCVGYGLKQLTATDTIQLWNTTLSSVDTISVTSVPTGGTASVNRMLSLVRIA